jgi:hypothetical protein
MTSEDFRRLALELPEAEEGEHMGHPDFRVRGKIFATLWPRGEDSGVLLLNREQQRRVIKSAPASFAPVPGGWGEKGSTIVRLGVADMKMVRRGLATAWLNKAPRSLGKTFTSKRLITAD